MTRLLLALAFAGALVACGGGGGSTPSATLATPPTTARTTTTQSVEAQVEAAYLKSWDVYTAAMRTFDTSHLVDVYVDAALKLRQGEVADLKTANTPAAMKVDHDYSVRVVDDYQASVVDAYRNHSVLVDPVSGRPTEADPNVIIRSQYVMLKVDGKWKIARVLAA
jgi:hypothetical protein